MPKCGKPRQGFQASFRNEWLETEFTVIILEHHAPPVVYFPLEHKNLYSKLKVYPLESHCCAYRQKFQTIWQKILI